MTQTTTYTIDGCTALITKIKGGYNVNTTSANLPEQFCNESAVSNNAQFKTIKQCKAHVDMLSITR